MPTTTRIIIACLLLYGCEASKPTRSPRATTYPALMAQATPESWRRSAAWIFEFLDGEERSMGSLTLLFTAEAVGAGSCSERHWKRALVVADSLDYDFGFDLDPAYTISGPWLTVDLTSSMCAVDHNLIGEVAEDGASGFFTVSHSIGGENLGTFTARAADNEARSDGHEN